MWTSHVLANPQFDHQYQTHILKLIKIKKAWTQYLRKNGPVSSSFKNIRWWSCSFFSIFSFFWFRIDALGLKLVLISVDLLFPCDLSSCFWDICAALEFPFKIILTSAALQHSPSIETYHQGFTNRRKFIATLFRNGEPLPKKICIVLPSENIHFWILFQWKLHRFTIHPIKIIVVQLKTILNQ